MSFEPEAFGKYFLVDKIATGGMAEIFKAKSFGHGGFENLIVIKRILSHLSENEDFVDMFVDEAKVSVALQHANIVRVYDFGRVLDNYYIAMECVDGKDVRAILRKLGRRKVYMPMEFALYVAHEACKGLAYAHEKTDLRGHPYGIVHRDMSPSNVLVSYDGDVKIADFGIAKAEQNTYNTADGVLKGKFEYMSPEQARGEEVDARSDLFSVGILLYEMLTGRRLFKGESDIATLEAIKRADVKPPSKVSSRIPGHVDRLVLKALSGDREERFQSAAQLQQALRRILPQPPDELHKEMATWLRDQFRDEIVEEVRRLEEGSALATEWRDTLPEETWDGNSTATLRTDPQRTLDDGSDRRGSGMVFVAVAVVLFLLVGAAGALGGYTMLNNGPEPVAATAPGVLGIEVSPAARIIVDGTLRGEGTTLRIENVDAGEHTVRFEIPGREAYEQLVQVASEKMAVIDYSFPPVEPLSSTVPMGSGTDEELEEEEAPKITSSGTSRSSGSRRRGASAAVTRPRVDFGSTPPGATVFVDGSAVGRTPMTWTGSAGETASVRLVLDGYEPATGSVSGLRNGQRTSFDRTLKKAAASPGTVTVGIIGGGWGNVFIDGKQQTKTAPTKFELPAGPHEIRVVNPDLGLDHTEKVTVTAGGNARVNARP